VRRPAPWPPAPPSARVRRPGGPYREPAPAPMCRGVWHRGRCLGCMDTTTPVLPFLRALRDILFLC
jgi:hypothetical protein